MMSSHGLGFWLGSTSLLATNYAKGMQKEVSMAMQAALAENSATGSIVNEAAILLAAAKAQFLAKSPPSLLLAMARVSGSDELENIT